VRFKGLPPGKLSLERRAKYYRARHQATDDCKGKGSLKEMADWRSLSFKRLSTTGKTVCPMVKHNKGGGGRNGGLLLCGEP